MTWSERFADYLKRRGIRRESAAYELRVSASCVHYWLNGSRARKPLRDRVEAWSRGEVPAEDAAPPASKRTGTDG